MASEPYDLVIIGAGVSGLAGSMYAGRLGLKTLVLGATSSSEFAVGGVITTTNVVENYPGFKKLTGQELAKKLEEHALEYDKVTIREERALEVKKEKNGFSVTTDGKKTYACDALMFATGTKWRELPMKGAAEYKNKGVHYCALCDAAMYKNKTVGIIGGSDSAAKEALVLAEHAKKVYIIYRREKIRPEPVNARLIEKNPKIEVITNTNVTEIHGDKFVNKVTLDNAYKGSKELALDGVFGAIGHIPLTELAEKIGVELDEKKEIVIDKQSKTSVEGIFAAGDAVNSPFKQAIVGVGEAVVAAHSAFEYFQRKKLGEEGGVETK